MQPLHTKRWDDPKTERDGTRILITRYRPRGLLKASETWTEWMPALGPSVELHAAAYGKGSRAGPIPWAVYRTAYLREMRDPRARVAIEALAQRVAEGEMICLLCSSQCVREDRCHRSLLRELIVAAVSRLRSTMS